MKMTVHRLDEFPEALAEPFSQGCKSLPLSKLAGGDGLVVNCDIIPPGQVSAKYHAHTLQEEFFFILEGEGVLRSEEGEVPVAARDYIAKPAGLSHPHQFRCTGAAPLVILDISLRRPGDVAHYPDDGVYLLRGEGVALSGGAPSGWTSEP